MAWHDVVPDFSDEDRQLRGRKLREGLRGWWLAKVKMNYGEAILRPLLTQSGRSPGFACKAPR
jgi:hypothetical protein